MWCDILQNARSSTDHAPSLKSQNHPDLCHCILPLEFDAHKPGKDALSQQGASDQELLRSAFKSCVEKKRKEAKSWYSERKRIIKASSRVQDFSHNLLYVSSGNPQGEFEILLPGAVP